MKQPELYHRTVGILVDAYFDDTLQHNNCYACAVGNIIFRNMGFQYEKVSNRDLKVRVIGLSNSSLRWPYVFVTDNFTGEQFCYPIGYKDEAKAQIDASGYSWQDLAKIEHAFEKAPKGNSDDEWMFNGLMAVIDVLDEIHENADATVAADSKSRFKFAYA